jgi:hypothetical protein
LSLGNLLDFAPNRRGVHDRLAAGHGASDVAGYRRPWHGLIHDLTYCNTCTQYLAYGAFNLSPSSQSNLAASMNSLIRIICALLLMVVSAIPWAGPADWQDQLSQIPAKDWSRAHAAHLLERAGFGGTPSELERFSAMSPVMAVRTLVRYQSVRQSLPPFEASGAFDPGLDPFSPSRPAATEKAKAEGEALGVKVKPQGNRRLQQVADRYLYWLRVSKLESQRIGYWWANRMLVTQRPLEEKMTLFWHGHFATSDEKVRDYRKMLNPAQHDDGSKSVLGERGRFDGVQVIDIILSKPVTAEFIATKLYRYFVREEISPEMRVKLGELLRDNKYEIAPFLEALFLSKDFYAEASVGTRIKPPVELVVSTYRKMGLREIPGIPDFNELTDAMGQKLLFPPNVAGWASGKSWITPGLLLVRGNFVYDTVFPPIDFVAKDRVPDDRYGIVPVADKLAMGVDITTATKPDGKEVTSMSMQNDRDEDFNTRLASYHAWRKAIEKVKPIPRTPAQLDLAKLVRDAGCLTTQQAVDHLLMRFLVVPVDADTRTKLAELLANDLGTTDLKLADSYMEDALRNTLHVILSLPIYQLG